MLCFMLDVRILEPGSTLLAMPLIIQHSDEPSSNSTFTLSKLRTMCSHRLSGILLSHSIENVSRLFLVLVLA